MAMIAYRTIVSESTGITPFKIVFGKKIRLGVDPIFKIECESSDPKNHLLKLVTELEDVYKRVRSII